jgi:hypothetical protein
MKKYTVYDKLFCRKCGFETKKKRKRKTGEPMLWAGLCPSCAEKFENTMADSGIDINTIDKYEKKCLIDDWVDGLI